MSNKNSRIIELTDDEISNIGGGWTVKEIRDTVCWGAATIVGAIIVIIISSWYRDRERRNHIQDFFGGTRGSAW